MMPHEDDEFWEAVFDEMDNGEKDSTAAAKKVVRRMASQSEAVCNCSARTTTVRPAKHAPCCPAGGRA